LGTDDITTTRFDLNQPDGSVKIYFYAKAPKSIAVTTNIDFRLSGVTVPENDAAGNPYATPFVKDNFDAISLLTYNGDD
jgi:hypothetical protein